MTREEQDGFGIFWLRYPRRVSKLAAMKAYEKALKLATHAEIMCGVELYLQHLPDPAYIPYPASWLNAGRWMDEHEAKQVAHIVNLNALDKHGAPWWHERCPHEPKCNGFRECRELIREVAS
jgi:hypothetical protein